MDSKGTLTVLTYTDQDRAGKVWAVLEVADTGTGMDDATVQRIFEPFFTTKDRVRGTGLGLSMVFGTMESHRGTVTVQSIPGTGTSFFCRFPVPEPTGIPAAGEPAEGEPSSGGTETLLLVEDEAAVRTVVKEILERAGYRVLTAPDGSQSGGLGPGTADPGRR